jgi:sialidase-1
MKPRFRFLAFLLALPFAAPAAVEHTDVFVSGQDGYHTYRIPVVLRAKDGSLLAFCEGRKSGMSDKGDIDLLVKRSRDDGRTWSAAQVIWDDGGNTCGNPCPVLDETTGTIWLFGTHNLGPDAEPDIIAKRAKGTRMPWLLHSTDHGRTWSKAVPQPALKLPAWGWYATGPGIGIQIRQGPHAGRLVIPCDHSYDDPNGTLRGGPFEYGSHAVYSDDRGQTWKLGGVIQPKVNECQVVELSDAPGRLLMNMRSYFDRHCRAEAWSTDGGQTWTPPQDQPLLIEPRAQASLLRHQWPAAGKPGVILFANPADRTDRVRMTVRLSTDNAKTWPRALVLHEEFAAYSSLVSLSADTAGCLYERGESAKRRSYERIVFARFALSDLQPVR